MRADPGVVVDTAANNALLAVLAAAGLCVEAEQVLEAMADCRCLPDVITFGTLAVGCAPAE